MAPEPGPSVAGGNAAESGAGGGSTAEGKAASWSVSLEAHGLSVNEAALRAAVERELIRAELPLATRPVHVAVSVDAGGSLRVLYKNALGTELSRSVAAPARAEEVPEASALLVGNLARDEASAVLAQLQAESPPPQPPAVVEPSPPAPDRSTAQPEPEATPELSLDNVNLTLFHPFALRSDSEHRHLLLDLGAFYSRNAAITGLSLTFAGVSRIDGRLRGVQLGSVGYWHGGSGGGVRIGGVFGVSREPFSGVSISGAASVEGERTGVDVAGVTSVARGPFAGAQLSGAFNHATALEGAQLTGALNVSRGPSSGVQVAGVANVSGDSVEGAQLAGASNIAGDVSGLQLSVLNVGGSVDGAQIGIVNVAQDVSGIQLGVVNVARSVRGQSIGLVPYNREGGIKLATWYNSSQPFNVGLRFHAGLLYMMPTFAYDPGSALLVDEPGRARYAPGTSLGLRIPLEGTPLSRAYVDVDTNYSQRSRGWEAVVNDFELRYRVLAGWRILEGFSMFAGGGLRHRVRAPQSVADRIGPELSVGMELL